MQDKDSGRRSTTATRRYFGMINMQRLSQHIRRALKSVNSFIEFILF